MTGSKISSFNSSRTIPHETIGAAHHVVGEPRLWNQRSEWLFAGSLRSTIWDKKFQDPSKRGVLASVHAWIYMRLGGIELCSYDSRRENLDTCISGNPRTVTAATGRATGCLLPTHQKRGVTRGRPTALDDAGRQGQAQNGRQERHTDLEKLHLGFWLRSFFLYTGRHLTENLMCSKRAAASAAEAR